MSDFDHNKAMGAMKKILRYEKLQPAVTCNVCAFCSGGLHPTCGNPLSGFVMFRGHAVAYLHGRKKVLSPRYYPQPPKWCKLPKQRVLYEGSTKR
jgi:hypothetical protein